MSDLPPLDVDLLDEPPTPAGAPTSNGDAPSSSSFDDPGYLTALDDDPEAGTTSPGNLPAKFWAARDRLGQVRQAAWARQRSPDAVLAGVLARVATLIAPTVHLPAIVGDTASLNLLVGTVGRSGAGKSTATGIARQLISIDRRDIVDGLALGSGEGLIDAYLGPLEQIDIGGAKTKIRPQVNTAVLAVVDEGQVLAELGGRRGATLLPTLRSAWSGATLGQANADPERRRRIEAGRYRFAGIIALQLEYAATLLDDAAGGTPQRIVWFAGTDPTIPDEPPAWPAPLGWTTPPTISGGVELGVADPIWTAVRARGLARARGEVVDLDPLDAHGDLLRLKVAAVLAVLDDRGNVNDDDWKLAGMVMAASRAVRTSIVEHQRHQNRIREDAGNARAARRELTIADSTERHAFDAAKRAVARHVHRDGAGSHLSRSEVARAVAGKHRQLVDIDDVIAAAIAEGWIEHDGDELIPGRSRPA